MRCSVCFLRWYLLDPIVCLFLHLVSRLVTLFQCTFEGQLYSAFFLCSGSNLIQDRDSSPAMWRLQFQFPQLRLSLSLVSSPLLLSYFGRNLC
ncbi:hypothetical protein BDW72DRAFT_113638 [Aspergillus terricola var. indicus]